MILHWQIARHNFKLGFGTMSTVKIPSRESKASTLPEPREGFIRSITRKGYHRIAYRDWGDEDNPDTVFCLHGLTRNSHDFDVIARRLSKTRRVICPDTVGRGKSEWLDHSYDYQLPQYNLDFTVLASTVGCQRFDLIGTSLGGLMGMTLAGMKNTPVRKLVINDIGPEVPYAALRRLTKYLGADPLFPSLNKLEQHLRSTLAPFAPMTDQDWKRMAATSSIETTEGYRLAFDPAISHNYRRYWYLVYLNLWRYWNRINCPVLILRGVESDFLTPSLLEKMLDRLPHADVIEFEGVGHTPTLNSPEQIEPVKAWLDQ